MIIKPHSVKVESKQAPIDAVTREVQEGAYQTIADGVECQITPLTSSVAMHNYGVVAKKPHLLLADLETALYWQVGNRVTWNGAHYFVLRDPLIFNAGAKITNHVQVVINLGLEQEAPQ